MEEMMQIKKTIALTILASGAILLNGFFGGKKLPESQRLTGNSKVNMRSANTYKGINEYEKALEKYKEVVEEKPQFIEALTNIGDIYFHFAEERPDKANEMYTEAFYHFERAVEAYNEISVDGELTELKTLADDAELKRRASWARLFNHAQENIKQQKLDDAIKEFSELKKITPDSTNIYIMLASIWQTKNDHNKAAEYFEEITKMDPNDTVSRKNLAQHYLQNKKYDEAIDWYEKVIGLEPNNTENYWNLAQVYIEYDNHKKALECFENIYTIDNEDTDAVINAGNFAYNLKMLDKAVKYYKIAIENNPEDTDTILYLLYVLNSQEQYEEMIKYGEMLYNADNTSKDAVQFIILAASKTNNSSLQKKYVDILNRMQ